MLKKNLFYNSLLSISQFIFPLITFPYSSRILGPLGIGSVNFIDSITTYFILVAALGIPTYGVREVAKRKTDAEALNKLTSEILFIHIVSTLVFSLFYLITALLVPSLKTHLDLIFVGISLLFINVLSVEWFFQGIEMFQYIAIRSLISKVLSIIFLFIFLKRNSPSIVYYLIGASGPTINGVFNILILSKHSNVRFTSLSLKKHIRPLVTILGSSLAVSVYLLMDSIILGFVKGDVEVGFYTTALRIARIPLAIIGAISAVIVPQVSRAYSNGEIETINSLIHKSFSFICVIGFPIAVGMFLESGFLVDSFAGKNFHSSIIIIKVLSPVIILVGIAQIFVVQLLNPIGQEKLLFRAVFIGMIVSLTSNLCLIPIFSYLGAAITNLLTEAVVATTGYFFVKRFLKITLDTKILFECLLGSILFFPIAFFIRNTGLNVIVKEIVIILTCMLFYGLYFWFAIRNIYIDSIKKLVIKKLRIKFILKAQS